MALTTPALALDGLVAQEGEVLSTYRCPAGVFTNWLGLPKGSEVLDPKPATITRAVSRRLLARALGRNCELRGKPSHAGHLSELLLKNGTLMYATIAVCLSSTLEIRYVETLAAFA